MSFLRPFVNTIPLELVICSHQADNPYYLWPDTIQYLYNTLLQALKKNMITHDTECP